MTTETKVKHTRGPWHASDDVVVQPHPQANTEFAKRQGYIVARSCYATEDGKPTAETLANTYLIAAAPEMLEALEAALPALEQGREFPGEVLEVAATVRDAIRKAKGI